MLCCFGDRRHAGFVAALFRGHPFSVEQGLSTIDCQSLIEVCRHVEWWDENFVVNVSKR